MRVETTSEPRIPEAPDREELVRVVNLYVNGFGTGTTQGFKEAFHPKARIHFLNPDGSLYGTTDEDWLLWEPDEFAGWASSAGRPHHSRGQIVKVIQAGDVGGVLVAMGTGSTVPAPGYDDWWVDFHTLLRIDGTWRDVSKTASHWSHGGWAGLVPPGTPEAPDRDQIVRVVGLYTDGYGLHDPAVIEEAFHPAARLYFTDGEGTFYEESAVEHVVGAGQRLSNRILTVIQTGDVAAALLRVSPPNNDEVSQSWLDCCSLLRIQGMWKIMALTATNGSRADWAGKA